MQVAKTKTTRFIMRYEKQSQNDATVVNHKIKMTHTSNCLYLGMYGI